MLGLNVTENGIVPKAGEDSSPYTHGLALMSSSLHPGVMKISSLTYSIVGAVSNAMLAENIDEFEEAARFCVSPSLK